MAMKHAREYELVTLWVRLESQRGEPAISVRFEATIDGKRTEIFTAGPFPASDFGLPTYGQSLSTTTLGVAPELVRQLSDWNKAENADRRPLWIHLIRPYGHLGMIPWEADLVPALEVPVLRLPDFIEPHRETASALDVAVVSSVPRGMGKGEIGSPELREIVEAAIGSTTARRVQVHVFADSEATTSLGGLGEAVKIHTPPARSKRRATRPAGNPWFEWIEDAMAGEALDAVHFLAHGVLGASGGMLALGPAPGDSTTVGGVYSSASQVSEFLTRIGAWSTAFHVPRRRETDLGLRQVADAIGAMRPGSVLLHDSLIDSGALAAAMTLLYGPEPQPAPISPGMFVFIQPRNVEHAGGGSRRRSLTSMNETWERNLPAGYATLFEEESIPSYVAATERLGDQVQVILSKGREMPGGTPLGDEESDAITKAMGALKSVVANYALESQSTTKSRGGKRS